uniref:Neprosin PEP catalytic domain-containing protein n=1 Tax=Aegilops tauschii TaxID=37682 RepID=M8AU48_AEGTA
MMQSTLLATHRYQSEVLRQRLSTRDELGFEDGAGEDVDEYESSHDERDVGDDEGFDFPLTEGSIPIEIAPPESKSAPAQVLPRDGGASSRKSSLIYILGKMASYRRRRAPEGICGPYKWAWCAQGMCLGACAKSSEDSIVSKPKMEPSSFPQSIPTKSPSIHASPPTQLSLIECPTGTIPILRNNRRVHKLVRAIGKVISKNEQQEVAGFEYLDVLYGTRAKINIYEPKVKNTSKDLSASWIQIKGIQRVGLADGIGAGSWVYPSYSGDNLARFHVAWVDGLKNTIFPDHDCGAFVQVSSIVGLGGRLKPVSIYGGPQYIIDVAIFKGGYVQGPTASSDSPQMGSGHFASEERGKASVVRNILIVDNENKYANPDARKARLVVTSSSKYTAKAYGYGYNDYGVHTYYGGPGAFV